LQRERKIVFVLTVHTVTYAGTFWMRDWIPCKDEQGKRFRKGIRETANRGQKERIARKRGF
jgi:hypothetical protein